MGRIILGLLINSKRKIKLIGDKSLSKRDFSRVTLPLKKFGAKFNKYKKLPIEMEGLKTKRNKLFRKERISAMQNDYNARSN